MKTIDYDLRYIQSGLEVLENYLLSDEMFWPLSINPPEGEPDYPRLTLGGLLLSCASLAAYQKLPSQADQVNQLISELNRIRSKWKVAWEKKAGYSYRVRLRMWRDFIEEYQNNPLENADRYSYTVCLRVMINLLNSEVGGQKQVEVDLLAGLDGYLKRMLELDGFIWEPEIQSGFPADVYWYLYGYLSPAAKKY